MPSLFVLSFVCSTVFLSTLIFVPFFKKGLRFGKDALSKYALGERGWFITSGLFLIALAEIFLSLGLARIYGFSLGNILLAGAGVGTIIVSLFKMETSEKTLRGYLHVFGAGIQFSFFPLALLLLSSALEESPLFVFTLATACSNLLLVSLIFFFFLTRRTHSFAYFGLIQKANIFLMTIWVMLASFMFIA